MYKVAKQESKVKQAKQVKVNNYKKTIDQSNVMIILFPHGVHRSPWRNRLARSAVNRKVGGSSPPRDVFQLNDQSENFAPALDHKSVKPCEKTII